MVKVGKKAPEFSVDAYDRGDFRAVSLTDYKGKWVVLFFYPLDFSSLCPTEVTAFNKHLDEFRKLNAEVVGASVDSKFSHKAWDEKDLGGIQFPILSDFNKEVSNRYGILDDRVNAAQRGTFIIDPEGILRYYVVSDLGVGRSVAETLRVLKALQTGEVCPAEWAPGEKTLGK
jgi:alkyl hydroperoxide reductase subunit AhpC